MTTTPPEIPRSPWAFVALVGAASLAVAWAVRRAGGLAQAITARTMPVSDLGALFAGDELGDEADEDTPTTYYADEPDEAPADTADTDEREPYGAQW